MSRRLSHQAVIARLLAFWFVLAGLLFSTGAQAQEPSNSNTAIGWPKPLPPLPPSQDAVYVRDGQVLSGTLTFLEAFATVKQGSGKKDIARDKVGLVLIAGKPFPKKFAQLPNKDDAVLLDSGEMLTGQVNVDGAGIHVNARTFPKKDVTLIRLKGPPETIYPDIEEPPEGEGERPPPPPPPPKTGGTGAGKKGAAPRGHGPEEIPWGKALWRGFFRFSWSPTQEAMQFQDKAEEEWLKRRPDMHMLRRGPVHGSYYITWREDSVTKIDAVRGVAVQLKIANLVYHAVFPGCYGGPEQTIAGSSFDVPVPGVPNPQPSYITLDAWEGPHYPANTNFGLSIMWTTTQGVHCNVAGTDEDEFGTDYGGLPQFLGVQEKDMLCLPAGYLRYGRTPPPYTTISDSFSCSHKDGNYHYQYAFIRGAPPINFEPDPCSACKTAQGHLQLARDIIKSLLAQLQELSKKVSDAKEELDRLNRVKASLHDYLSKLLLAAMAADVGKRLLQIVAADGATQIGGALDEKSAYGLKLKGFMECLLATAPVIKGFVDHNPDYIDYVKGLPRAASRRGCTLMKRDVKIEDMESDSFGDLINAAKEEVELGEVLADAIGLGTGGAEAEYIQEHLGELGLLVPEDVLQHAEQYLKLIEESTDKLREIKELNTKVLDDTLALADLGVVVNALEQDMGKCKGSGC